MVLLSLKHLAGGLGEGKGQAGPKKAADLRIVPPTLMAEERHQLPRRHHPIHRRDERNERLPILVSGDTEVKIFLVQIN